MTTLITITRVTTMPVMTTGDTSQHRVTKRTMGTRIMATITITITGMGMGMGTVTPPPISAWLSPSALG